MLLYVITLARYPGVNTSLNKFLQNKIFHRKQNLHPSKTEFSFAPHFFFFFWRGGGSNSISLAIHISETQYI